MRKKSIVLKGLFVLASFFLLSGTTILAQEPCEGNFDCDQDVDGTDAALFKSDFGRSQFNNSCPACVVGEWCVY